MFSRQREDGTLSDLATGKILHFETSELLAKRLEKAKKTLEDPTRAQYKP